MDALRDFPAEETKAKAFQQIRQRTFSPMVKGMVGGMIGTAIMLLVGLLVWTAYVDHQNLKAVIQVLNNAQRQQQPATPPRPQP